MKRLICFALMGALAAPTFATVVNFDDLTGSGAVASGYGGIDNWGSWAYYDSSQPPYNPSSGLERVYNSTDGAFSWSAPVIFDGAFVNGHGDLDGFAPINFDMYLGGSLVASSGQAHLDGSGNGIFLNSGYSGQVDKVVVNGSQDFYIMDDVTYHVVPEPVSMIALGAGLLAIARKRRNR